MFAGAIHSNCAENELLPLRAKEMNTVFDTVFVPAGTVEISPAVHCRERRRMNPRPVGTLDSPLAQDSSVRTGRCKNSATTRR